MPSFFWKRALTHGAFTGVLTIPQGLRHSLRGFLHQVWGTRHGK